jgi:hypothetical protein
MIWLSKFWDETNTNIRFVELCMLPCIKKIIQQEI